MLNYAQQQALTIDGLKIYGEKAERVGVVSFHFGECRDCFGYGMILD
ncbi:hypothetical protein BPO_1495 [Bergeyella porcorum]|uniref:Uncharacterized protein n=1 Tax=Bergeyella porcorum TaxID=1735111 RepID=A0AAU0F1T3_9FLAO